MGSDMPGFLEKLLFQRNFCYYAWQKSGFNVKDRNLRGIFSWQKVPKTMLGTMVAKSVA